MILGVLLFGLGCVSPQASYVRDAKPVQSEYSREAVNAAPVALGKALEMISDSTTRKPFRVDMRRFSDGWRVEIIYLPESPDYWNEVRVYDDGKILKAR